MNSVKNYKSEIEVGDFLVDRVHGGKFKVLDITEHKVNNQHRIRYWTKHGYISKSAAKSRYTLIKGEQPICIQL